MKNLLKIFLISSSICACKNSSGDKSTNNEVSSQDSIVQKSVNAGDPEDAEKETAQKATAALLSSKREIMLMQSDLTDSLSKSGLAQDRKSLFKKTIKQLEVTSDLVNKQLEQILVSDLVASEDKLKGIVNEMKTSEKKLGQMASRLNKITNFMQDAVVLLQSVKP